MILNNKSYLDDSIAPGRKQYLSFNSSPWSDEDDAINLKNFINPFPPMFPNSLQIESLLPVVYNAS